MKNKFLPVPLLALLLLQACGGGGGGGGGVPLLPAATGTPPAAPAETAPAASADAGSVSAPFARGTSARHLLLGIGSQVFGNLTQSEQAPSGAMVRLNDITLTGGNRVTKDIAGDASFAIGRWTAGTVTRSSGAETLTGQDNRTYHYLAANNLQALPTSGAATCDAGKFTTPTYVGGTAGAQSGSASGSAQLVFDGSGVTVSGSIKVTVGSESGNVSLGDAKIASTTSTAITGAFLSGGAGAALQLGDHGGGAYLLGVGYSATLPNGARYTGIAKFRCA